MPRISSRAWAGKTVLAPAILALAFAPLAAQPLHAQFSTIPEPAAYALEGVTVVSADGRRTTGVTIVVRDGRIATLERGAAVPPGVRVLEGDSLFVYPGMVDAEGTAKFGFPEPDRTQAVSWDPPRDVQGFTPHRRVADVLESTGSDGASQRKAGIVAAAVFPQPALMAGQGTVLLLRPNASAPSQLVVNPNVGQLFGFRGGRGAYPGTLFGVVAFQRQAFENARHAAAVHAADSRNGGGVASLDPDYAALQEVLSGNSRVYFAANSAPDILRAVQLGDEFGFTPVIVGGQEAWKLAPELRRRNVTVLVSLNVPRPRRWRPPTEGSPMEGSMADSASANGGADDAAVQREKEAYEAIYSNPARLAEAGVTFALTTGGGAADLREGVRTAIRYGLSEEAALAAVTTTPATHLGITPVTRVAAGGPATFVVTSSPIFDSGSRVVYTFVEGALERGSSASTPARGGAGSGRGGPGAAEGAPASAAGSWDTEIVSEQGTLTGTMRLQAAEGGFSGTIQSEFGDLPVSNGRIQGDNVSFTVSFPFMGDASASFTGTITGDRMSGSASTPVGDIRWSATRSGPPGPGLEVHEEEQWHGHAHGTQPSVGEPAAAAFESNSR